MQFSNQTLLFGFDGDHPVVRCGLDSVFVEHIDTGATNASGIVVEIESVTVSLGLQLIGELALGQVVG